jgi:ABC-type transporter Mla subunit MlaD
MGAGMRVPLNRIEKMTGVAVLLAGALLALWLVMASRKAVGDLLRGTTKYHVVAGTGMGTNVGSPVMLYDVEVGSVSAVTFIEDPAYPEKRVRFTIRIDARAARMLTEETTVVLGTGLSALGSSTVELKPAGKGLLKPGSTLIAAERPSLLHMLTKDAAAFMDQLSHLMAEAEPILKNVREITEKVRQGHGIAGHLLANDELAEQVHSSLDDIRKLLASVDGVVRKADGALDAAPAITKNLSHASGEADKALVHVNAAIEAVPQIVTALQATISELHQLLLTIKVAAAYAPELARKADTSIDEAQRLVEALQKNFLIRGNLPSRPDARTESASRPALAAPRLPARAQPSASASAVRKP